MNLVDTFTARTDPERVRLRRVIAFVDESGDRNCEANRQSDHFIMTAVLVEEEHEDALRAIILGHRALWRITDQLHWKEHLRPKRAGRRALLVGALARLPYVRVVHVIVDKTALRPEAYMRGNQEAFYNWVAKLLLERIGDAAACWPGGERLARVCFGLVGGVDPSETDRYLNQECLRARRDPSDPRAQGLRNNIQWPLKIEATSSRDGLQAADQYCGMMATAVNHDDAQWVDMTRHQLHVGRAGRVQGAGIKIFPEHSDLSHKPWYTKK